MKPPQKNQVICGSNLEVVKSWPPNIISAIVCDPPYGLEFMGKEWDKLNLNVPFSEKETGGLGGYKHHIRFGKDSNAMQQWHYQWAKAMLRITKPGGFLLCFGGTRTYHRLACAIEDAGWEIRDCMMWLYGSGFPKSHNISKAIDKAAGATREVIGISNRGCQPNYKCTSKDSKHIELTNPATNLAQLWDGYGTALKPAWEPIIVAMKPLDGTFAHNAEAHGVAGLNIDAARIGSNPGYKYNADKNGTTFNGQQGERIKQTAEKKGQQFIESSQGRWPANLILDEEAGAILDEQSGKRSSGGSATRKSRQEGQTYSTGKERIITPRFDSGGASRFFYCAKTSRKERNMGMENLKNSHPTVKPLALMKYLCTLLKMPSAEQIILDPFLGSGTTGIACKELGINFIGIEKEPEYCEIAVKRIAAIEGTEITLHTDNPPAEVPKAIPCHDEHRQSIINAAVAALRRNQK